MVKDSDSARNRLPQRVFLGLGALSMAAIVGFFGWTATYLAYYNRVAHRDYERCTTHPMPTSVAEFQKSFGSPGPTIHTDDGRRLLYFDPSPQYAATWSMDIQATIDPDTGMIASVWCGE